MNQHMMLKQLRPAIMMIVLFTVITGVLYPLLVTGVAQIFFPEKANGSLLKREGETLGSALIGQPFSDPKYFWSRPSATVPFEYNAAASAGSNLAPANALLLDGVRKRVAALRDADPLNAEAVPVDLVTASASGLDPHISVAAALYQLPRVARVRALAQERVRALVDGCTRGREFGLLGEPRVNVLELNLLLDGKAPNGEGE